jgi:hypothetical protein
MRISAFAALAFAASGCTIHVVEQPATPMIVAEAPRPAPTRITRPRRVVDRASATADARAPAPPAIDRPEPVTTAPRQPLRTPYRTTAPETRPTQVASNDTTVHYRRLKVRRGAKPVTRVTSASITKAQ